MTKDKTNSEKERFGHLKKIPNWMLYVFSPILFFTSFVIFVTPIWFLIQIRGLNALTVNEKISDKMFRVFIVYFGVSLLAFMIYGDTLTNSGNDIFLVPFILTFITLYIILLFRAKDILQNFSEQNGKNIIVSGVGTFFLGIFYL